MRRPNSARQQWLRLTLALAMTIACVGILPGCSARQSSPPPPVTAPAATAGVSALDEGGKVEPASHEPTDTCEGVLNCTFFGLGAVLAVPFWVLGTVLGLTFS